MKLTQDVIAKVVTGICECEDKGWGAPPPVHPVFNLFPVRRVMKSEHASGEGDLKKEIRGYCWLETDRWYQLTNKCGAVSSCHRLDNTDYSYRAGNLNYVQCPYFACLFASRRHPDDTRDWRNSGYGIQTSEGYREVDCRPYTAVVNCFLMGNEDGEPHLFLSRLYDSERGEYPWDSTIMRYAVAHCRRAGLGLAVNTSCNPSCRYEVETRFRARGIYGDEGEETFRTPPFAPPGETAYDWSQDANLELRYDPGTGSEWYYEGEGRIVIPPCRPKWERHFPNGIRYPSSGYHVETCSMAGPEYQCEECGRELDEEDIHCSPDGNDYCLRCFDRHCYRCHWCAETGWRDDRILVDGDDWCTDCAGRHASPCYSCEQHFTPIWMYMVDGEKYCERCREGLPHCPGCHIPHAEGSIPPRQHEYCDACYARMETCTDCEVPTREYSMVGSMCRFCYDSTRQQIRLPEPGACGMLEVSL